MLKPLIPIVSDALAHTFNESIHIGTVHAIYGNNHLAMAVASTASEDNNKNQTTLRFEEPVPLHIVTEHIANVLCLLSTIVAFTLFRARKWTAIYLSLQLPPPEFFL